MGFLVESIVVSSKSAWRTGFAICSALLRSSSLIALLNSLPFAVIRLLIWSGLKSSGNGSTYRNIHVQYVTTYRYWLLKVTTCHLICMQCDARVNIIKDILYLHRQMNRWSRHAICISHCDIELHSIIPRQLSRWQPWVNTITRAVVQQPM